MSSSISYFIHTGNYNTKFAAVYDDDYFCLTGVDGLIEIYLYQE